jgi:hypothetical protein
MPDERPRALDTAVAFVVLVAVCVQTWTVLNESTNGELELQLRHWWRIKGNPALQRFRDWVSSAEITERMVNEEIVPFLEREAQL